MHAVVFKRNDGDACGAVGAWCAVAVTCACVLVGVKPPTRFFLFFILVNAGTTRAAVAARGGAIRLGRCDALFLCSGLPHFQASFVATFTVLGFPPPKQSNPRINNDNNKRKSVRCALVFPLG
jgi:hypothetical protein